MSKHWKLEDLPDKFRGQALRQIESQGPGAALMYDMASEKDLQAWVADQARTYGWMHYHTYDSRRSTSGFPDSILMHTSRPAMVAELKQEGHWPTADQIQWLDAWAAQGVRTFLWWPSDMEAIIKALSGSDADALEPWTIRAAARARAGS